MKLNPLIIYKNTLEMKSIKIIQTSLLVLMVSLITMMNTSCRKDSSISQIQTSVGLVGTWKCQPNQPLSQSDTSYLVANGQTYLFYELDYIIYEPVNFVYDASSNTITINGTQGIYTVSGTGYFIGQDTMKLTYTISPSPWTNYSNTYYRLQ